MSSSSIAAIPQSRASARIALIGLNESDAAFLTDCFRQFKLQAVLVDQDPELALRKEKFATLSEEISNGGMSLATNDLLPGKTSVRVTFSLPDKGKISIMATICWRREAERSFGVQFFADDPQRHLVRQWIDAFLEME